MEKTQCCICKIGNQCPPDNRQTCIILIGETRELVLRQIKIENAVKAKKRKKHETQHTATAYLTTICYLLVKRRACILF